MDIRLIKYMKIVIKNIIKFLKKMPLAIAKHAFEFCLLLIFLAAAIGALIFYKYAVLMEEKEVEIDNPPPQFNEILSQKVLRQKAEQEKRFQEADSKEYPNLF